MENKMKKFDSLSVIDIKEENKCPLCNLGDGALCYTHELMSKDFEWLKNYINEQEKIDKKIIYLLEFAIGDRKAYIINDVRIENGRMMIEECLEKKDISMFFEKKLKEIIALEKARSTVIRMMKEE